MYIIMLAESTYIVDIYTLEMYILLAPKSNFRKRDLAKSVLEIR